MSRVFAALICACALASPAPSPPRHKEHKACQKFVSHAARSTRRRHAAFTSDSSERTRPIRRRKGEEERGVGVGGVVLMSDSKIIQEKTIVVRRMPNAYFYPFSLWPLPKFPAREREDSMESFNHKRSLTNIQIKGHKR